MTLDTQIAALTQSTNDMLTAVNTRKSTFDSSIAAASTQAGAAAGSAAQARLDRVQTGSDKTATAADRVQTGLDRVQTGLDVIAANAAAAVYSDVQIALMQQATSLINTQAIVVAHHGFA